MLYSRPGIAIRRVVPEKLSNSDDNKIHIELENQNKFTVTLEVWDELPVQLQYRDFFLTLTLNGGQGKVATYTIKPQKRGEYTFGFTHVYARTALGFIQRRYQSHDERIIPSYPSYLQMRQYELMAFNYRYEQAGFRKIRRIGQQKEFEHIRDYVKGDDYRTLNWKATARTGKLMVNQYQDERAQPVYCVIDKGRLMRMPFEGLSLLDYSINASLALSNIVLKKSDKAGLITFSEDKVQVLAAGNRGGHLNSIQEMLYNQKTRYLESNFELLHNTIRRRLNHRSLLLLFTNFESRSSAQRQMGYLKSLSRFHLLVVIFFENTEVQKLLYRNATDTETIYQKAIAEKLVLEKHLIVSDLQAAGIQTVLTPPRQLTLQTINKYLELKARQLI